MIFLGVALRKGQEAVRATILEATESAAGLAIKDDGFATDGAGKRRVLEFVVPGDGVPEVTQEHGRNPFESVVS
jgi:hypothetical protein